jgi:transposase-like protein
MRTGGLAVPFGGNGGNVEVDETYVGANLTKANRKSRENAKPKAKVLSLVDRTSGLAYSVVIDNINWHTVRPILLDNISHEARVLTDEAAHYNVVGVYFGGHETVNHSADEYVRYADRSVHTNTVEGYFSLFKRGMRGVYQHCGRKHLHRYLAEFDFRYNNRIALGINDSQRAENVLKNIAGKRLTYQ